MASVSSANINTDEEIKETAFDETVPNAETLEAIEDVRNGRNLVGPFYTVEELMKYLNADD